MILSENKMEIKVKKCGIEDEMPNDYIRKIDINLNKNYGNASALQRLPCN